MLEVVSRPRGPAEPYRYRIEVLNPYTPSDVDARSVVQASETNRHAVKLMGTLAILLLSLLGAVGGLITGVLAGFFYGTSVFGDAGDFMMMFVTPFILAGGLVGAVGGALAGAAIGGLMAAVLRGR
ncbi:MAG: hypothetical protein AAGJ40_04410 [Planctomycetota bacterium]